MSSNFAFCWELGGDLGHITLLANISRHLKQRGHRVCAIVKDTTHAMRYLQPLGIPWFQAPKAMAPLLKKAPLNHADILLGNGYGNSSCLTGLIQAWSSLLGLLRPDCVITEAAPTASLAARRLGLRCINLDEGFFSPPLSSPLPALRDWLPSSEEHLKEREEYVIAQVDRALSSLGLPALHTYNELFELDTYWLTWPELNHFGHHSPERHIGPCWGASNGIRLPWSAGGGRRIFAYLKPGHPESLAALRWCIAQGFQVLAYLPRWSTQLTAQLQASGRLVSSPEPLDLEWALQTCDAALCHGGTGTVTRSLGMGKPLLLLPVQVEQFRTARNLVQQGLALLPFKPGESETFGFQTLRLDACGKNARLFAASRPAQSHTMDRLIDLLESRACQEWRR
jgi:hypothetical protein